MIRQKSNQWQVRVYAGRDPITGRERFEYGTAPNERAAKKLEGRLMTEVADGRRKGTKVKTVADLMDQWFEWRKTSGEGLSPGTAYNYERDITLRILPGLGRLSLRELDAATLDDFYTKLRRRGGKCQRCAQRVRAGERPLRAGECFRPRPGATEQVHETDCAKGLPLSASKVHQIHAILSGSLQQAVRWGWLTHNPARLATPPSVKRGRSAKVVPPAVTDAIRLLTEAQGSDPELGLFLRLASVLGSRRGELCSLRWTDLDFEHGEALVDSGVIYVPGQPLIDKDTKESDKRRVAVDPATMQMAEDHRRRAERIAVEFGITLPVDAYVFSHEPDGSKPIRPDGVSHRFSKLRDRLGLTCRLHDLRHFMVTQLLSAGVDLRTVAGRAGHADGGAMTLSVYGHFQRAKDREAAVLISGFLAGQSDPPLVEHG